MIHFFRMQAVQVLLAFSVILHISHSSLAFAQPCGKCAKVDAPAKCVGCQAIRYCNRDCQTQDWPHHKKFCLACKALTHGVRIANSKITGAGRGLFASRDFKVGETLAIYYGESVEKTLPTLIRLGASAYFQTIPEKPTLLFDGTAQPPAPHLGAQIANDPYMNPESLDDLLNVDCTHLSEDYRSKLRTIFLGYWDAFLKDRLSYQTGENVRIEYDSLLNLLVFRAKKPISKDQEILHLYEPDYWLMIPAQICYRKGRADTALAIQRETSIATEEAFRTATHPKTRNFYKQLMETGPNYLSINKLEALSPYSNSILFRIAGLFTVPTHLIPSTMVLSDFAEEIKKALLGFPHLDERLEEIERLPNSDFYDDANYGKIHLKSRQLISDIAESMETRGAGYIPAFITHQTRKPIYWRDLVNLLPSEPISQATPSNSHQYQIER